MNATIKKTIVFLFFFIGFSVKAQNLDSLIKVLPKMKEDTNKTILLEQITFLFIYSDLEMFKKYADSLLLLSDKIGDSRRKFKAYQSHGEYYFRKNDWSNMKKSFNKAQTFLDDKFRKRDMASINSVYAKYYAKMGDFETAIDLNLKSLRAFEELGDKTGEAVTLSTIAFLMVQKKRDEDAEKYYLKAAAIRKELGDKRGESLIYLNLGALYSEQEKTEDSYHYIQKALKIQQSLNDKVIIAHCESNLANIHNQKGEYNKSLELSEKCLNYYSQQNDYRTSIIIHIYRAVSYTGLKNQAEALKQLDLAYQLVKNNELLSEMKLYVYNQYYKTYKEFGNTAKALDYYEVAVKIDEENNTLEMQNNISKVKELYETEKKEQENTELRQINEINQLKIKNNRYFIIGIGVLSLLAIIVLVLILRNNKIKAREKNLQIQQKLLVSQMNPHFIFNSLNSIQNFIYKQDAQNAAIYLNRFSELMRMILTFSRKEQVTLAEEKQLLERYLDIQKLRFGEKLEWEISVNEEIDEENVLIQPMLAQPFIENSLEHGLFKTDETGKIFIHFKKENNYLIFEIEDNGVGLNKTEKKSGKHESLATIITSERIAGIKTLSGKNTTFDIINLWEIDSEKQGVKVVFKIPYETVL